MTQNLKFTLGRVDNTLGKGDNTGYQHFLLFPLCFQKLSFDEDVKSLDPALKRSSFTKQQVLDWFKLKAFPDDKVTVTQKLKFVLERMKKIVERGENADWLHFLLLPEFSQGFYLGLLNLYYTILTSNDPETEGF